MLEIFKLTLITVAVLLLVAAPGYIMIKKKMLSEGSIAEFSKILLYVAQTCLAVYTFLQIEFSLEKLSELGIFALMSFGIMVVMLMGAYLVLRKRCEKPIYRIMTIATTFSNCGFFGIPIIEALLGEAASELIVYTTIFSLVMNVAGWTVGSAIISQNAKYMSVKKIFLNPATISVAVALVIFVFSIPIEPNVSNMIGVTGRMATPLSMVIMGMRLGTMKLSTLFKDVKVFITIAIKMIVMPLVAFAFVYFLPIEVGVKMTFYIVSACPCASVVLNFSELVGEGQKEAAAMVLMSTMCSIVIMPVMMLLLPLLGG
jgi:predicted permease